MNNKRKIRKLIYISDTALATIIMGLTMIILGGAMSISAVSMLDLYRPDDSFSKMILVTLMSGISFFISGSIIDMFCILLTTLNMSEKKLKMLFYTAVTSIAFNAVQLLVVIIIRAAFTEYAIALSALAISGAVLILIRHLRISEKRTDEAKYAEENISLKKVS
jgi:hypothetical protein